MYLALIPDADSLAALRRFAPSLPSDAHVTIIHSRNSLEVYQAAGTAPLTVPKWSGTLSLRTNGVAPFGGRDKRLALRLFISAELRAIRAQAELILRDAGLPWSAKWPLSPHLTLGDLRAKTAPPDMLRFDRMEWR